MTELIVLRAFLCIGEHRISLGDFFEFFFRRFVARVPIGMVLQGRFAISFLDFIFAGSAANAE
jgi:hypothetical protein